MIAESKELIEKNKKDKTGCFCTETTEKKVKVSLIEFCKEGDTKNLMTNRHLARDIERAFTELEENIDEADLLKGLIDYQFYHVTESF